MSCTIQHLPTTTVKVGNGKFTSTIHDVRQNQIIKSIDEKAKSDNNEKRTNTFETFRYFLQEV